MSASAPLAQSPPASSARAQPVRPPRRTMLSLVPSPIKAKRAPFVALLLVLLAAALVTLLLLNTASAQDAFKLHALQSQEAALAQDIQTYTSKGDGLDDPAVLAARATALGMIPGGIPVFLARGAALPAGGIRFGNMVYIPGPVLVPVRAAPKVAKAPVAKVTTAPVAKTPAKTAAKATTKTPARSSTKTTAKTPVATRSTAVTAKKPRTKAPVTKTPAAKTNTPPTATTGTATTGTATTGTATTTGTTAGGH